jgi:L-lactate dehydrogenase complex protein LldF
VLVHLRARVVDAHQSSRGERAAMKALGWTFADERRYERAQQLGRIGAGPFARDGVIRSLPAMGAWTETRDLRAPARRTFREWWTNR